MSAWEGKVALVTGAATGIGQALASELARGGARVVLSDRDGERAAQAARALPGARALTLDVTGREAVEEAVEEVWSREGALDLLVNNAGVGLTGPVEELSAADWTPVLEVNLSGVVHGVQAAYPRMLRQGRGTILNVASGAGLLPRVGLVPYTASKYAVVGLSLALRAEAAGRGVGVHVACPGWVGSEILARTRYVGLDPERIAATLAGLPWGPQPPAACARRILRGVARGQAVITTDALTRVEWWLHRLSPALGLTLARWRGARLLACRLPVPASPPALLA